MESIDNLDMNLGDITIKSKYKGEFASKCTMEFNPKTEIIKEIHILNNKTCIWEYPLSEANIQKM